MAIEFLYNKKTFTIKAESYNELSAKQLLKIGNLFLKKLPKDIAELKALKILLGFNLYRFFRIPLDAKKKMVEEIQWVFDDRNHLTNQLISCYQKNIFSKKYYAPASEFDNLTMAEWNSCEIYYEQLITDKDETALDYLIAVLYRPAKANYDIAKNVDGDVREPFNPNTIDARAGIISQWPANVKYAILQWFDGCRESITDLYDLFSGSSTKEKTQPGMFELIRGLCGTKYGSFKEVEQMNVHMAMRELELMKEEAAKI
jgi:hypothetical protein